MKEFAQKREYKAKRSRLVTTVIASVVIVNLLYIKVDL